MEYARFVRLRTPVWDAFESGLGRLRRRRVEHEELEEVAFRYRQVLHDHALAAARYPGTGAAERLRRLALEGTHRLAPGEARRSGGLGTFFAVTFPRAFRSQLGILGVAVALFLGAAVFGVLGAVIRPELGVMFIGEAARADLARGRLWTESLVTTTPPAAASSSIATNNMSVSITAWAGGATAGLLTLYVILLNGFLLGTVFGLTGQYSMAGELGTFVAAHGPLEITLILVAGAAGLTVARSMLTAGDRPRGEAMAAAARRAVTVLLGVLPWLLLLGTVEAWISPRPEIPVAAKAALGIGLWLLFWVVALNPFSGRLHRRRTAEETA